MKMKLDVFLTNFLYNKWESFIRNNRTFFFCTLINKLYRRSCSSLFLLFINANLTLYRQIDQFLWK